MMMANERLRLELLKLRANGTRQFQIARAAGFHPSQLSQILGGAISIKPNDPRVVRLCRLVGLSKAEAFVPDETRQ